MAGLLPHIAAEVLNCPLLCTPDYAEAMVGALGGRISLDVSPQSAGGFDYRERNAAAPAEYDVVNGVAHIPIIGSLTHRGSNLSAASGLHGYNAVQAKIDAALSDRDVSSILLEMDSPGGSVAGAFDFADWLHAQKGRKRIIALAKDQMASAAYLIGSQADEVWMTQTAMVGSIGVMLVHVDRSKALD